MSCRSVAKIRRPSRRAAVSAYQWTLFECGLTAAPESVPSHRRSSYRFPTHDDLPSRSLDRAKANLRAIQLVKTIEEERRLATPEEQTILAKYVGWGGIPTAFDTSHPDFGAFANTLHAALTPEEYASARSSTLTAFYTPIWLIDAMYTLAARLGIQGGRVIEPGMGTGRFLGRVPHAMAGHVSWTGIEIDTLTGRIARLLYPDADVRIGSYETTRLPDDTFDLCVANLPWGQYQVHDPNDRGCRWKIADYCIVRTLDLLKPGGTMLVITGCATMDSANTALRDYVHERADLIGAVRLPETTFVATAHTRTPADVIVLRKRITADVPVGSSWRTLETVPVRGHSGQSHETCRINEYFAARPTMMLGEMAVTRRQYGMRQTCVANPDLDLAAAMADVMSHFPEGVCHVPPSAGLDLVHTNATSGHPSAASTASTIAIVPSGSSEVPDGLKDGAYTTVNGTIMIYEDGALVPVPVKRSHVDRVIALIAIRDAARAVLHVQMDETSPTDIEATQVKLNALYDRFVQRYGPINYTVKQGEDRRRRPNLDPFRHDPDAALVSALERYDEDTNTAEKNPIFTARVIAPHCSPAHVDSAEDALAISLDVRGQVDVAYMAQLTTKSESALIQALAGVIYEDPELRRWVTAETYLSGNVRAKLRSAEYAATTDPRFRANAQALHTVIPVDIPPSEISVALGAPWLSVDDVTEFIQMLLGGTAGVTVSHIAREALWHVTAPTLRRSVAATSTWGTSRVDAIELVEGALNQQAVTVYDTQLDGSRVVNSDETLAAREKQQTIKDRFAAWIWEDHARAVRLARLYNDRFNNLRTCTYQGAHLTLPGASPAFRWRPHQKDAVWRILQTGDALIGHAVGAGKTAVLCAAVMEERRLGLSRKPLVIVPSEVLGQFAADWLTLYPGARLLIATKEDMSRANRHRFVARIATGDWDGILMAHSTFGKIPLSRTFETQMVQAEVDELIDMEVEAKCEGNRRTVKSLARLRKQYEKRLADLTNRADKDDGVCFEELGVDRILVDEADKYKNLMFTTKIAGVANPASQRAWHLYLVTRYLHQAHPGRALVFATGTPIANSVAELWTMMRYVQPAYLRSVGLDHFDAWAAQYGESVTTLELAPDGASYRLATRFAQFRNVPELIQSWHLAADIRTEDMLDLPRPQVFGGKPNVIAVPASPEQRRFIESLSQRADRVKSGAIPPNVDNMLAICTDGRRAALDMRLVHAHVADSAESKVNRAVAEIVRIWHETAEDRGAQLVFCDLSTPAAVGFTVYQDLCTKLKQAGIPKQEIAFIHDAPTDAARVRLFANVRAGRKRILIGSTEKCGAGVNVQTRLVAMHELDAPWRPRDVMQRSGRIVRQGNRYNVVQLYRYVTTGTFDTYIWQGLERKQRFIAQVMQADLNVRRIEDVDSVALNYAEVKAIATGNPLIMEKSGVDIEITRLTRLRRTYGDEQFRLRMKLARAPEQIAMVTRDIHAVTVDCARRRDVSGEAFAVTLAGVRYTDRGAAGEALVKMITSMTSVSVSMRQAALGEYAGFSLRLQRGLVSDSCCLTLVGEAEYHGSELAFGQLHPGGLVQRLSNLLQSMDTRLATLEARLADMTKELAELERLVGLPFEHEDRLQQLFAQQKALNDALRIGMTDRQTIGLAAGGDDSDTTQDKSADDRTEREDDEVEEIMDGHPCIGIQTDAFPSAVRYEGPTACVA